MFASKDTLLTRPSGYTIARSVRLRSSASAYFNRTPASASNRKTYTFSCWAKRGSLSSNQNIVAQGNNEVLFRFNTTDNINFADYTGGSAVWEITSSSVYRDPSAWYHIVFAIDTTQATSSNRVKVWINNSQVTFTGTYPTLNSDTPFNTTNAMLIGNRTGVSQYFDGYLTEINFIDGQALTPSSFGETDSITGVWKAKKYSGTYGTNGFYLNFSDNSSNTATTIGKDYSGNGNNWTPNNISVTSGSTYDSMTDVPTLTSATAGNYAVLNPLDKSTRVTCSDGNLTASFDSTANHSAVKATIGMTTGKWYWEVIVPTMSGTTQVDNVGVQDGVTSPTGLQYGSSGTGFGWGYNNSSGYFYGSNCTTSGTPTNLSAGTIGFAYDADNGKIWVRKQDGNWNQGDPATGTSPNGTFSSPPTLFAGMSFYGTTNGTFYFNFGQRPFSYTPPTGFVALNTFNLPDSTIKNGAGYMAATTYTGNATARSISNAVNGVSFQPDLVWLKNRTTAYGHVLQDSIRGTSVYLASNSTAADTAASLVTAFNSDGFAVSTSNVVNENSAGIVGWQWKAGGTSSSNTNGSITSTVSAGATQGFSVVTYTGTGANATVGHGLGVAPSMIIAKDRGSVSNWNVYHTSLGNTQAVLLNSTNATNTSSGYWNNTSPTSTVFSVGTGTSFTSGLAYCFAAVAGYSAFGSYTGNGSTDGPFVYTGFRPRFVLWKRITTAGGHWGIIDSGRNTYNLANLSILANASDGDATNVQVLDLVSNGFKIRTSDGGQNLNADTFIYAVFAENPFKHSLAR